MSRKWLCAQRAGATRIEPTVHDTEAEAIAEADTLARGGKLAVVYEADLEDL